MWYNKNCVLYPQPLTCQKEFLQFYMCQLWALHVVTKRQFFTFINYRNGQERRTASLCLILTKSLKPWRRYVSFRCFKMAAAAILNFWSYKMLRAGMVKRVDLHHPAKFLQNWSNRGRDMGVFRFFSLFFLYVVGSVYSFRDRKH